jgi:hypothetical protein
VGVSNARTSFQQTEKSPTTTVSSQALSAGVPASQTTRQDGVALIDQKGELPNSTFALLFQALINQSRAIAI